MSSRKTRGRGVQQLGELLKVPFRRNKSRSPSPGPASTPKPGFSDTPASTPDTALNTSVICGSSASLDKGIATPARPPHVFGGQSPNTQSPAIPTPKNTAFQQAIEKYLDKLSPDDKLAFQSATDVQEKLAVLQQDKPQTSSSHASRAEKVQKVLKCVKKFLVSVGICIQQSPEISSLVVGGLNCILTVSSTSSINQLFCISHIYITTPYMGMGPPARL